MKTFPGSRSINQESALIWVNDLNLLMALTLHRSKQFLRDVVASFLHLDMQSGKRSILHFKTFMGLGEDPLLYIFTKIAIVSAITFAR